VFNVLAEGFDVFTLSTNGLCGESPYLSIGHVA